MRIKYMCYRCKYPVVMSVSNCEIDNNSTEASATVYFEDPYDEGGRVVLSDIPLTEALRLQEGIFRYGYQDITQFAVIEDGIIADDCDDTAVRTKLAEAKEGFIELAATIDEYLNGSN